MSLYKHYENEKNSRLSSGNSKVLRKPTLITPQPLLGITTPKNKPLDASMSMRNIRSDKSANQVVNQFSYDKIHDILHQLVDSNIRKPAKKSSTQNSRLSSRYRRRGEASGDVLSRGLMGVLASKVIFYF